MKFSGSRRRPPPSGVGGRLSQALALAAVAHFAFFVILWRTWPVRIPEGEVVPIELHPVEPPVPPPPPPLVAEPAVAPAHKSSKAGGGKSSAKIELAVAPEGETPAGSPEPLAAAQNAMGSGNGSGPATASVGGGKPGGMGASPTGIVKPPDHRSLLAEAMERIRQHRRYPELARRRHLEGTVVVAFRVGENGSIENAHVKRGVDEMLDQAALDAVRESSPLPSPLASDGELEVDLHFSLQP